MKQYSERKLLENEQNLIIKCQELCQIKLRVKLGDHNLVVTFPDADCLCLANPWNFAA